MSDLFSPFRKLFTSGRTGNALVAQKLHQVKDGGIKLELQEMDSTQTTPTLIVLGIESVGENGFLVTRPKTDSARHLVKGRTYRLGYYEGGSRLIGETICQGRAQYLDERKRLVYTYRFTIPESLEVEPERLISTRGKRLEQELEVELSSFKHRSPIYGMMVQLGRHSAKIRCHNALNKLQVGQDVYLKMELPQPVGLVTEMMRITDLLPTPSGKELLVAVSFHTRVKGLEDLLESGVLCGLNRKAG